MPEQNPQNDEIARVGQQPRAKLQSSSRKLGRAQAQVGLGAIIAKVKKKKDRAARRRVDRVPKKERPFAPPDGSLLSDIAERAVSDWLRGNSPIGEKSSSPRLVPTTETPEDFELKLASKIRSGLCDRIRDLTGGPYVKKTALRRQLESLAQQLLVRFAALERFRPPKEQVLRKAALEAARRDCVVNRVPNFKKLCLQYCAIFMQYNDGNQVEEYLYLALQREMERLKSGPLRSRRDIDSRIEAAINLAYHQIEATLCAIADLGQLYGSVEDETFTVRYVMSTFEKRQEVFLTAQMVNGRRDQSVILGISSSKQFHTTHSRGKDAPAYCNCPASLRQ